MLQTYEFFVIDTERLLNVSKALSTPQRLDIMKLLSDSSMSIKEISTKLKQPYSSTMLNIEFLEKAGLVETITNYTNMGKIRLCRRLCDKLIIWLNSKMDVSANETVYNIPIGSYINYNIEKPCGMITSEGSLKTDDNPNIFFHEKRHDAILFWFYHGFVEYKFDMTNINKNFKSVELSFEACSEAPLYRNDFKSDITVWINGTEIGSYTCPSDFGGRRGQFYPEFWPSNLTQYGMLLYWVITDTSVSVNDCIIKKTNIDKLGIRENDVLSIKIGVKKNAKNLGGINLFGSKMGDYAQDIRLKFNY